MTQMFGDLLGQTGFTPEWEGGFENPMEATKAKELNLRITGYIAGRKNTLTPDINLNQAKAAFTEAVTKLLTEKGAKSVKIPSLNEDGEATNKFIEITADTRYTKTNLRSIDYDTYLDCVKGYYRVNMKEARPEYLVAELVDRRGKTADDLSGNESISAAQRAARVYSKNGQFILIKEKPLVETLVEHETSVVGVYNGDKEVGRAIPEIAQSKRNPENFSRRFKYIYDEKFVRNIAHLDVPRAVNRDYEGAVPADIIEVTNAEDAKALFPGAEPNNMGLTKPYVKAKEGEPNMRTMEEIPYDAYKEAYEKMGVTEEMLAAVRGARIKTIDAITIDDIAVRSRKAYQMFKQMNS